MAAVIGRKTLCMQCATTVLGLPSQRLRTSIQDVPDPVGPTIAEAPAENEDSSVHLRTNRRPSYPLIGNTYCRWRSLLCLSHPAEEAFASHSPLVIIRAAQHVGYLPAHMGDFEGWTMLAVRLGLLFYSFREKITRKDSRMVAYLIVSSALWILVSATTAKNYLLGLPFYLLLWLFSSMTVASFLRTANRHKRIIAWLMPLILCMYVGFHVVRSVYEFQNWLTTATPAGQENRRLTQSIAADLRAVLSNNDTFMWAPAYGFPATLEY
jgi:hypothetical protein